MLCYFCLVFHNFYCREYRALVLEQLIVNSKMHLLDPLRESQINQLFSIVDLINLRGRSKGGDGVEITDGSACATT